jgi:hypothetical protein
MYKKIVCMIVFVFFTVSCGDTLSSAKRGLTGEKKNSNDEFLVQKKDPLIFPPDYENLPLPNDDENKKEEVSNFEKTLGVVTEDNSSTTGSTENSILKRIQSQ